MGTKIRTRKSPRPNHVGALPSPYLYPVVTKSRNVQLSDEQFAELEKQGGVSLSAASRRDLNILGTEWCDNELRRQSARTKHFHKLIRKTTAALNKAAAALEWHPDNASTLQQHFLNWIVNQEHGNDLLVQAGNLISAIGVHRTSLASLEHSLPHDPGRARPRLDEQSIRQLSQIYERAGAKPTLKKTTYQEDGYADTAYRRFAKAYYTMLPLATKRVPSGFDGALFDAVPRRKRAVR